MQISFLAGLQPDSICDAATTPTFPKFPFDIFPGICLVCWKIDFLMQKDRLEHYAFLCCVYFPFMAPYKTYLCKWWRICTPDTTLSFFIISLINREDLSYSSKQNQFNQHFISNTKCCLGCFSSWEALGLISWSVSLCKQQTVFMFAVT